MRRPFDSVHFESCEPLLNYYSSGYNLTNKDGIVLMYVPKENHYAGVDSPVSKEFDWENATQQWFNSLTGEFTDEVKFGLRNVGTMIVVAALARVWSNVGNHRPESVATRMMR